MVLTTQNIIQLYSVADQKLNSILLHREQKYKSLKTLKKHDINMQQKSQKHTQIQFKLHTKNLTNFTNLQNDPCQLLKFKNSQKH